LRGVKPALSEHDSMSMMSMLDEDELDVTGIDIGSSPPDVALERSVRNVNTREELSKIAEVR
ncbi:MAG: hypothetical protein SXQ77_10070, partial [Halobacteria archaeon]|nr:hypothetical protein [Halobacteria archaeon]